MKYIKIVLPYICVILSAFLAAYSVRAFINTAGLLTSGLTGICLIISRYVGMLYYDTNLADLLNNLSQMDFVNTLTSILFFTINIPLVILAFKKLGKRFATLSTVYIIANTLFITFLPNSIMNLFALNDGGLSNAIFAGVCSGIAVSLALNMGGSTAGLEIVATYYSRKKQISLGKILIIINTVIILTGGIFFQEWTSMLYTLILVFVSGKIVDEMHRLTRKIVIYIISDEYAKITKEISEQTKYNCTVSKSVGGYSGNDKYSIITVVPENKTDLIINIVNNLDEKAFIITMDSKNVHGNFYIEPLK